MEALGKKYLFLCVYFLLALTLIWPLLGEGYFITLDMQFGPHSFSDFTFQDLYGFSSNPYGANLPLRLVLDPLSQMMGMELMEKALLFAVLFLCGAGMHLSLPEDLKGSRYFAGLLYMLNPFVFVRFLSGHWMFLLSYAFWPLALKAFIDFLERPSQKHALEKASLLTALVAVSSHGILLLLVAYACAFMFRLAGSLDKRGLLAKTAVLAGLVLLLNLFWILPSLLLFSPTFNGAPASAYLEDFGAQGGDLPLPVALLSMHGFWREGFTYTKDVFSLWQAPFLVIAVLACIGLFVLISRKNPLGFPLAILFVLAFLLAMGSKGPLDWIFSLFGDSIPVYFIFRDTQKIVGLMCLVYSILGAYGTHHILQMLKGNRMAAPLLLLLLSVPVIYNYGFFGFLDQARLTQYPEDWVKAESIISSDPTQTSILVLPPHTYMEFPWVNAPFGTIGNPAGAFFSKPAITAAAVETRNIYSDVKNPQTAYLSHLFSKRNEVNNTAELLLPLNARYIIVIMDQRDSLDAVTLLYQKPDIEFLFKGRNIMLFRNNLARGRFFASDDPGTGDFSVLTNPGSQIRYSPDVEYSMVTPASYRISGSDYPYIVYGGEYMDYFTYPGSPVSSWHGIGSAFQSPSPGVFENRFFYVVLTLFILSWAVGFVLLSGQGTKAALPIVLASAVVFMLSIIGILTPAIMGTLLVPSVAIALALRYVSNLPAFVAKYVRI